MERLKRRRSQQSHQHRARSRRSSGWSLNRPIDHAIDLARHDEIILVQSLIFLVLRETVHLLRSYQRYSNDARTHLSLNKDAPALRAVQAVGRIVANPHLGGLHH
jgi:hypothetical protein